MNSNAPSAKDTQPSADRQPAPSTNHRSSSSVHGTPPLQQYHHFPRPNPSYSQPAPPTLDARASASLTPIRTPSSYATGSSSYPFPQPYQSPAAATPQDRYPAVTPGGRPPSIIHSHAQYQASPSSFAPPPQPHSATHSHHSGTPTSTHSQSPYILRESPHPGPPHSHNSYGHAQHPSQPTTPLGPPPAQYARMSGYSQQQPPPPSPYAPLNRSASGASINAGRSATSHSPAQSNAAIGNITGSPASFAAPSAYLKRTSTDYVSNGDRERSVSVSPKTRVMSYPSQGSRQNSQGPLSQRGSFAEPRPSSSEPRVYMQQIAHVPSLSRSGTDNMNHSIASPLSHTRSFSSHTPHLSNILTGDRPATSQSNHSAAQYNFPHRSSSIDQPPSQFIPDSRMPQKRSSEVTTSSHMSTESPIVTKTSLQPTSSSFTSESLLQQPISRQPEAIIPEPTHLKRPAEEAPEARPEPKKARRRYIEPPIWARVAKSNPRYEKQAAAHPTTTTSSSAPSRAPPKHTTPRPQAQVVTPQTNGHAPPTQSGPPPAQQYGSEKARVAKVMGMPWEVSITDYKPMEPILQVVGEFIYKQLLSRPELITGDAKAGGIEIEAKIGTLFDRRNNDRLSIPVLTPTIIHEQFSHANIRFESAMTTVSTSESIHPALVFH